MTQITATINSAAILAKVGMLVSFVARTAKEEGENIYDSVRITEQDEPQLEHFIEEAKENIVAEYAGISGVNTSGNITFTLPDEWLEEHEDTIGQECVNFIVNYCCRCWFNLRYPPKVEEYQNKGAMNIQKLNDLLYSRKAPGEQDGTEMPDFIRLH